MLKRNRTNLNGERNENKSTEGDDTMAAVTTNFVFSVNGKKITDKKEPAVTQEKLAQIKTVLGKYLVKEK